LEAKAEIPICIRLRTLGGPYEGKKPERKGRRGGFVCLEGGGVRANGPIQSLILWRPGMIKGGEREGELEG